MLEGFPPRSPGRNVGLGLILALIVIDVLIGVTMMNLPLGIPTILLGLVIILSIPIGIGIATLTANLNTARYYVKEGYFAADWGRLRQAVYLRHIKSIEAGSDSDAQIHFRGIRWPGMLFGRGRYIHSEGKDLPLIVIASRPFDQQLFLICPDAVIGISPTDLPEFSASMRALWKASSEVGPDNPEFVSDMGFWDWDVWGDRIFQISLILSLLIFILQFIFVSMQLDGLPVSLPLHFDDFGQPDQYGSSKMLFVLPLIGVITWLVASIFGGTFDIWRREKPVAYIVWGSAIAIQLTTWGVLLSVLERL